MSRAKPKKTRKEFKQLWREAAEEVYGPFLPNGAARGGTESRGGTVRFLGVYRDESGQRFQVCTTGDPKYFLFAPLYRETSITWGDPFPVLKSSLPRKLRSALNHGWDNDAPRPRAVFSFGEEGHPFTVRDALDAIEEARRLSPRPAYLILTAEEFEPEVITLVRKIESTEGITLLAARRVEGEFVFE